MSLGGGYVQSVNDAVRGATNAGLVMVVAAGNENRDACVGSPGSEPTAITVGATDSNDVRASYSNFGPCKLYTARLGVQACLVLARQCSRHALHLAGQLSLHEPNTMHTVTSIVALV